jgi:hypothetical protein
MSFPPGESTTNAAMDVRLGTGDEPVPVIRPVPHSEELREGLRASWPSVQQCYASEVAGHPDAGGRMDLRFRLGAAGEVVEVEEDGVTRFANVDVTRCVLGVYRAAKLPAVAPGSPRSFVYSLHFESPREATP